MLGMNRVTGKPLLDRNHILQSIHDILTTRVGNRVMLREYGGKLLDLVDKPANDLLDIELQAETAVALERWEPRFKLDAVVIQNRKADGHVTIAIDGILVSDGTPVRIEGIVL